MSALPSPDGRHVYVVCAGTRQRPGSAQVIDTVTGVVTRLGTTPLYNACEAALSRDGRTLVVPDAGTGEVPGSMISIIDTATGAGRTVPVDGGPDGVAITPDGREAWVTTDDSELWRVPLAP